MTNRKPTYLGLIFVSAVLCTFPSLLFLFHELSQSWSMRRMPFQVPYNFGRVIQAEDVISHTPFWQDRFVYPSLDHLRQNFLYWNLTTIDPRTKANMILPLALETRANWGVQPLTFGSRLWLIGNGTSFEVVDGKARPSSMIAPTAAFHEQQRFLLAGEPAFVQHGPSGLVVSTFNAGAWVVSYDLVLPDRSPAQFIDGIPIDFANVTKASCVNQGDRIHLFLEIGGLEGRLLHHGGLSLRPVASATPGVGPIEQPVSAIESANTSDSLAGWTVVDKQRIPGTGKFCKYPAFGNRLATLVNGQPGAVIADDSNPSAVVGHLFRLENGYWSEFATQTFPFGTTSIRTVVSDDGQSSFIVASTSTGMVHVFEVNATGIEPTPRSQPLKLESFGAVRSLAEAGAILVFALMLAGLFGFGTTLSMRFYSPPDYAFRDQHVKLAAIGWRALARLIDIGLIVFSTAALAWWLTRQLDWLSLVEALNLKVAHPTVQSAIRIAWTLILWLVVCEGLIVVAQARWGVTFGKWCCGLRSMQTSLRPCGFARSLVREFVLWVDTCGFLCWTPGIASIALTDRRQRLGDIIADTIVVNASSMKSPKS